MRIKWLTQVGKPRRLLLAVVGLLACGMAAGEATPREFRGHEGSVCAAFSPDGKHLVTAADDGLIKIWDVASGQSLRTIPAGEQGITDVAYSPDGTLFATAGRDQNTRLWNTRSGVVERTLEGHRHHVSSLAFEPSGRSIATGSLDHNVIQWDVKTGARLRWFSGHSKVVSTVAFSPDGALIASGGGDGLGKSGELFVWDIVSGKSTWNVKGKGETQVVKVAFAPNGKSLAAGGVTGVVRVFETATGRVLQTLDGKDELRGLAYAPDGKTLAMAIAKEVKLWDLGSGTVTQTLSGSDGWVGPVSYSPDGSRIAAGCSDGSARVWELTPAGAKPASKTEASATHATS